MEKLEANLNTENLVVLPGFEVSQVKPVTKIVTRVNVSAGTLPGWPRSSQTV